MNNDKRAGFEAAAKAITERAAGHYRMKNYELQDELLQCASMLHDMKPAASNPPEIEGIKTVEFDGISPDRATSAGAAPTMDTPEFQRLAEYWRGEPYGTRSFENAWAELVAHIDQHTAAAVAYWQELAEGYKDQWEGVKAELDEWLHTNKVDELQREVIRLRAATAPVSAAPTATDERLIEALKAIQYCCAVPAGAAMRRIAINALAARASLPPSAGAPATSMADAYAGAREDLAIWKRRALEAESNLAGSLRALGLENGPTFMGEPVSSAGAPVSAAEQAPDYRLYELLRKRRAAIVAADDVALQKAEKEIIAHIMVAAPSNYQAIKPAPVQPQPSGITGELADGKELPALPGHQGEFGGMRLFDLYTLRQYARAALAMRQPQGDAVKALREVRQALQFANDSPNGPITDTIWMMHGPETLFDYIDAALDRAAKQAGKE